VWYYGGVVSAIGPDWVEIGAGWRGTVEVDEDSGRKWVRENGDTKKSKRISVAGTKPGGDPDGEGRGLTYQLTDLKVGDGVFIESAEGQDGTEWTVAIEIKRRPGGKIPAMRDDPFPHLGLHLRYQGYQDWEEKRIPIPDQYLDPYGQAPWTNPPYLPPMRAPMPREAKPAMPQPTPPAKPDMP
jgi:hypothetical protein